MYIQQVEISGRDGFSAEALTDFGVEYLSVLRMNGQVCGREWPMFMQNGRCVARVLTPALDALDAAHHGQYVLRTLNEGATQGISVATHVVAEDCASAGACGCRAPSAYILFTTFVSLESPVCCLDCFLPVPLYRLPVLSSGDYCALLCWQSDYQSCDSLQMNCSVLEKAATKQLSMLDSRLAVQGREACETLMRQVDKPFYYYLLRSTGRSVAAETKRLCPSCGQAWRLHERLHGVFDFKCDECRLVSNVAWNLSPIRPIEGG